MGTSFGLSDHHQAIYENLKRLLYVVQNRQFIWDPIY